MTRRTALVRDALLCGLGAVCYTLLGRCALRLAETQVNASAVWPMSGLAIGVLSRVGIRYWPAVFLGSLATNLWVNFSAGDATAAALLSAVGIAGGNTLEAVMGTCLMRRALGNPPQLAKAGGVFRLVGYVCFAPAALSAACGVCSLWVTGLVPASRVPWTALTWFTGNVSGIIGVAPLFLVGIWQTRLVGRRLSIAVTERAVALGLLAFVGQTICGVYFALTLRDWPKSYMAVPLVLWIAFRLGRRDTMLAGLFLLSIGVVGTLRGYVAFPADKPEQSLLSLQLFISTVIVVGLTVAASVHQVRLHRRSLEQIVREKSSRLVSVQQQKALLAASAMHDLQSPLSGLRNVLDWVRRAPASLAGAPGVALLGEMQDSVERMLVLIGAALQAEQQGREDHAPEEGAPCDLVTLIDRVIARERMHAEAKDIQLRCCLPSEVIILASGGASVEHIAGNFLSNAVKFSAPGSTVQVTLEKTGNRVSIRVEDEGPGISPEERRDIFTRHARGGRAKPTAHEPGSGLGLYLAGRLAEQVGASLSCEAASSGGSVFAVSLDLDAFDGERRKPTPTTAVCV